MGRFGHIIQQLIHWQTIQDHLQAAVLKVVAVLTVVAVKEVLAVKEAVAVKEVVAIRLRLKKLSMALKENNMTLNNNCI